MKIVEQSSEIAFLLLLGFIYFIGENNLFACKLSAIIAKSYETDKYLWGRKNAMGAEKCKKILSVQA